MSDNKLREIAYARLRSFVSDHIHGGCKILSQGDDCTCLLCDLDRVYALNQQQRAVPVQSHYKDGICEGKSYPSYIRLSDATAPTIAQEGK
jgi:hypothetical protein